MQCFLSFDGNKCTGGNYSTVFAEPSNFGNLVFGSVRLFINQVARTFYQSHDNQPFLVYNLG